MTEQTAVAVEVELVAHRPERLAELDSHRALRTRRSRMVRAEMVEQTQRLRVGLIPVTAATVLRMIHCRQPQAAPESLS